MIPKIIHLCWLSGEKYPDNIRKCIDSIYAHLPDYEIRIWTKDNFDIESVLWVKQAFLVKKYAFAADYIRFWCLYHFGGIYLDSDVEVLSSFNAFLDCGSFMGFEYLNIPEAAVIGAEQGKGWIKSCLDWYEGQSFFYKTGHVKTDVVPLLVKNVIEKRFGEILFDDGCIKKIDDLIVYPYYYFSPKNYFTGNIKIREETVCIHRFASAWGPAKKRKWTLFLHSIVIHIVGKKIHDRLYRLIKPLPVTFNGVSV